ncbi:MAG: cellulose synthase complex periplasmic endoglucanase BcsZ [Sulfuricaulis sp.]
MRLRAIVFLVILWYAMASACASASPSSEWPEWNDFVARFVQADGRVMDITFGSKSTSEGQSYGLFFALVADQRNEFDTILKWTSDNLAAGQLGNKLPAWLWGLRDDGSWGVKDKNSASDADLWIAYSLLEAARLWKSPHYADIGRQMLIQIRRQEVTQAGSAGPVLLPGYGFALDKGRFRIDPSYLPGFIFRYLASADPNGPWQSVWNGYMRMAPQIFSAGVAPDLFVVDSTGKVMPDTEREPSGSYDAIRVYLWAGMSGRNSQEMVKMLSTYAALIRKQGVPPEKVNPITGVAIKSNYSPIGFSGAVLPFLSALGDKSTLKIQLDRVRADLVRAKQGEQTNYYDQVLILFGKGWLDGQYRFDDQGRLQPKWVN